MTRMLLIIGGGILRMMSACAAVNPGGFSDIIVTQALGPSGASHHSGGVHFPYGCQGRTKSLTRKTPWSWRPWLVGR